MREYIVANCETASLNGTYVPNTLDNTPYEWLLFDGNGLDWENVVGRLTCDEDGYIALEDFLTGSYFYNVNWEISPITPDDPEITWVYWDEDLQEEVPSSLTVTGGAWRFVFNLAAPSIIISGAGISEINGGYFESGTEGGRPQYTMGGCYVYWITGFEGEGWYIVGERNFYYSADDVATPDLVTTWTLAMYGSLPVPSVTAAPPTYKITGTNVTLTHTPASGQNLTLTCAAGSYSLTGSSVTLTHTPASQNLTLACNAGSYSLTGTNADLTVTRHYTLSCDAGSYSLTGTNADLTVKRNYVLDAVYPDMIVSGAVGNADYVNGYYALTGENEGKPSYIHTSVESWIWWTESFWYLGDGAFYSTDNVATPDLVTTWVPLGEPIPPPTVTATNAYKLTGTDATLTVQRNYTLVCEPGSYSLTGTDITFGNSKAYSLTCEAGAYTLTGSSVSFVIQRNYSLACETGSYTLTGSDVTLTYTQGAQNFTLACETGSYALTGTNAGLTVQRNYTLECASGSYSLTGSDVTLDPTFHYSLTLESGSYTLTGTDVTLTKTTGAQSYTLVCSAGSYALTGTNTGLTSARTIALASGSYALTGTNASLFKGLVLPCASGTYTLTGSDATFNANYVFALGMGSYVLVGTACGLFILSPTPACRTATIEHENRTFAIPHENRTATIEYENRTLEVKCH